MHRFYRIHQTKKFKKELEAIQPEVSRAQEFYEAARIALSRNPRVGTEIGSEVWMISMVGPQFEPPAIIFYTFDALNVWLLSIRVSDLDRIDSDF